MIDQIDREVLAWARSHGASAILSPPIAAVDRNTVCLHLLRLLNEPVARAAGKEVKLQLVLQYLVTSNAAAPETAHQVLWSLILSAVEQSRSEGWRVDFGPLSDSVWMAFGVSPQPCFLLGIPLSYEWKQPETPRVTRAPELETSPVVSLTGRLLDSGKRPIAGACLELPTLSLSTHTDANGQFRFPLLPAGGFYPDEILVKAKRRNQVVKLPASRTGAPLIIELTTNED